MIRFALYLRKITLTFVVRAFVVRAFVARAFVALAFAALATPALAHAHLVKSMPAKGAAIKSPKHVVLTFSEALEPAFSGALLLDAEGRNLSGGPVKIDGSVMTLTPDRLAPGRYSVNWHAVGHDTHRSEGEFAFIVTK
jgi:methionine-rich copper-binding protein CopC